MRVAYDLLDGGAHVHDGLEQLLRLGGGGELGVFTGVRGDGGLCDFADQSWRHALSVKIGEEGDAYPFGSGIAVRNRADLGEIGADGVNPRLDLLRGAQFVTTVDADFVDVFILRHSSVG